MESLSVALPPALKKYIRQRVAQGGYGSASEYVRELIRHDRHRAAQAALEAELLGGLASGPAEKMTDDDWSSIRRTLQHAKPHQNKK